ncbi:putative phloem protein [Helianthus annuus]|nr:putative phloem protein [Helianthus annuus]KAJ0872493.1 putative phloem protein [Helianthus annuus]
MKYCEYCGLFENDCVCGHNSIRSDWSWVSDDDDTNKSYMCRFQRVVKMMDTSNLKIHIKIKTQFLTPNVNHGAHLVFKFCEPRKLSSKLMYVNLKYQMGSETRHAYFATCGDDEWMMIELCRFIPHKKNIGFEVLLESMSRYYCGGGGIYVEGIHFRAINDENLKVLFLFSSFISSLYT